MRLAFCESWGAVLCIDMGDESTEDKSLKSDEDSARRLPHSIQI